MFVPAPVGLDPSAAVEPDDCVVLGFGDGADRVERAAEAGFESPAERRSAGADVGTCLGVAAAALCLVFAKNLMRLFFGSIDDDVMAAGLTYLHITALSFPFIALYNAGAAIFRSVGNSKVSMQVSLLMNGINVVGNAICIFVLKMGVAGGCRSYGGFPVRGGGGHSASRGQAQSGALPEMGRHLPC